SVAESMLGKPGPAHIVAAAAGIVRDLPDLDHRRAEPGDCRRLDRVAEPRLDRLGDRAAEHRARSDRDRAAVEGGDLQRIVDAAGTAAVDLTHLRDRVGGDDVAPGEAGAFLGLAPGGTL